MDPRLETLLSRLQRSRFSDLSGSEVRATIRIAAPLLNEAAAGFVASTAAVQDVVIKPRASNRLDLSVKLTRPAFLPPVNLTLHIERQPQPSNPELVLRVSGLGGIMRFAGPAVGLFAALPPGVRLDGDHLFVNIATLLREHGQGDLLPYAQEIVVLTEEGTLVLQVQLRVP
jgi:hypothetical protein